MSNENNALKVHYSRSPSNTEIYHYSGDLMVRLGALPDEITLKNDSGDSVRMELYSYARDYGDQIDKENGAKPSVEELKARQEIVYSILDEVNAQITLSNEKMSADIDKVCKTVETYIKGKLLEIKAEHEKITVDAQDKIKESFNKKIA